MKKSSRRLLRKQVLKYFIIILVAILGMGLYRIMWSIPDNAFFWMIGIIATIFITLAVFDAVSVKDMISIFKG